MKGKEVTICGEGANSAIVMRQILLCIASVLAFSSDTFAFQVVGVSDGDTMTVLVDRKPLIICLANIDAPEKNQAFPPSIYFKKSKEIKNPKRLICALGGH